MNLLITGAWKTAKENICLLEKMGHRVVFMQNEQEKLPCEYEWVEAVICNGLFQYHSIEKFKNLKYIQLTSVGLDRVPMEYIAYNKIALHNAGNVYSIPMSEMVVAGVLEILKKSRFFFENQKNHKWEKNRHLLELHNKKVCIIGCGNVGKECAKRFNAFGCEVYGINRSVVTDDNFIQVETMEALDKYLPVMDIVILAVPLTKETSKIINRKRLGVLKDGSIIVNVARGELVDTEVLLEVLPRLGGAVLDVFEEEPLSGENELWEMENVIVFPHNSFVGEKNEERLQNIILTNIKKELV